LLKLTRWGNMTAEQGTTHEVEDRIAAKLIARGYAEEYDENAEVPEEEEGVDPKDYKRGEI